MCDPAQCVSGSQPQSDTRHPRVPDAGGRGHTRHQSGRDEHHQGGQWSLARQVTSEHAGQGGDLTLDLF